MSNGNRLTFRISMRSYIAFGLTICVIIASTDAFFTDKLTLLRSLTGGLGSDNSGSGHRYATNYNGANYGYNVLGRSLNTGSGSHGSGYNYGRTAFYDNANQGGDQVVRIIKVVVPAQDTSYANSGYATSYSGDRYSSGWTPVQSDPAPVYVNQAAPVQVRTVQVTQPAPVQISQPAPVQISQPADVQVSQPATVEERTYQPVPLQTQSVVKTLKLIVTEDDGNRNYVGPAANTYSSGYNYGYGARQNNDNWNPAYVAFPNLWNKSWKSAAGWEKLGC